MKIKSIFIYIFIILILNITINIILYGYEDDRFNEKYYDLFGNRIFRGSPIFLLDEQYNNFSESENNTSYLNKSDVLFDKPGKRMTFTLENSAYKILFDIGYGLISYFTPLTLNKIYDGVRIKEEIFSINLKGDFFITRETANDLYERNFASEEKIRDLSLGLHITKEINKFNKLGVTYINKHTSEGIIPNTKLGIIGPSVEIPSPSLYIRIRNPYSSLLASVKEIKVYMNNTLIGDINVISDDTFLEANVSRDSSFIYVKGDNLGYAIYKLPIPIPVDNITSLKFEFIGVKRDYLFEVSFDSYTYRKIIDVIDVKGESGNDSAVYYNVTKELSSDEINLLKQDVEKGTLLMSQIIGVNGNFYIFDFNINSEYALNINDYGLYKVGKGNKERKEYYNAYYIKIKRSFFNKKVNIGGAYFYIDKDFSDSSFIMDDDDKDGLPDNIQTEIYPYIIPLPGADKNYNGLVDWNEWLTLNNPSPIFRYGRDLNNNFILDTLENDNKIDLPYSQDRKGFNVFITYSLPIATNKITLEYHKRNRISNDDKTEYFNLIFKGSYKIGENVLVGLNDNYKYIIKDNITNNVIGLIDGADNNKDGFIDFGSELTNKYYDTLNKEDIHYNNFNLRTSINILKNLVFTYNFLYRSKIFSNLNIKNGITKRMLLHYTYNMFDNVTFISIANLSTFSIDPYVDTVGFKREGFIKSILFATRTSLVNGARFNTGIEISHYKDYRNYIEYYMYLGKIEFYYIIKNYYFLAMGYNYYNYNYIGTFDANDREYEQIYIQLRFKR